MSALPDHRWLTRLDGRGVVVLGVGGGSIGTAATRLLAAAGADLLCVDIDERAAAEVAEQVRGEHHVADITDRAQMEKLFARADALFGTGFFGVVDVVGAGRAGRIETFDDETIEQTFSLNFRHALLTTQIAGPMLAKRGSGAMVFVGSVAGLVAAPDQVIYDSAKAALHQLVRHAAQEFGPHGVRSNVVAPAVVMTCRLAASAAPGVIEAICESTPLRRLADPEDVAGAILFLLCGLSRHVNGIVLNVDGGTMTGAGLPRTQRT